MFEYKFHAIIQALICILSVLENRNEQDEEIKLAEYKYIQSTKLLLENLDIYRGKR